jgi:hypothetical protein
VTAACPVFLTVYRHPPGRSSSPAFPISPSRRLGGNSRIQNRSGRQQLELSGPVAHRAFDYDRAH